jgi:glycosyltransferase involved in cell wall biosynthesis
LTRYKGAYLLLEALRYTKNSNIQFVFVGSSHHGKDYIEPEFLELKKSLSAEGSKKLTLTGFITPEKTKTYYDKADLVVFPSLWQEPSGLVLFEAWARGIPVLATNVGGIPELVNKFHHAELVSPKITPQKLAATIETLLKNKSKLKSLSIKGLQFAKHYGNFKRMAKDFETILKAASAGSDSLN